MQHMKSKHCSASDILLETAEAFEAINTSVSSFQSHDKRNCNVTMKRELPFEKSTFDASKKQKLTLNVDVSKVNGSMPSLNKFDKSVCINAVSNNISLKNRRHDLPIFKVRDHIIEVVKGEPTVIFVGDTACGKTTQIPQYILEEGICHKKRIAVTQPRRVAAITIAERVAQEMDSTVGNEVGYCVRFEDVTSDVTSIKYMTDGMLLRESIGDPLLLQYSIVILDEAHERSLHTDVLFGIVKEAQHQRKEKHLLQLKVIVMSATMDYEHFSVFFDHAPVYRVLGREYKIKILNSVKKQEDYVFSALATVLKIHRENDGGDILVFCTGSEEIQSMVSEVRKIASSFQGQGYLKLLPYPLYAALPPKQQKLVFNAAPEDSRKVIFSTNIAETSITIPGIKYVVDTGMVKARTFNAISGFDVLKVVRISKAQAKQRAGRAGREFDGHCYRLYTSEEFLNFRNFTIPEIQRCNLSSVILQIVALGVRNIKQFNFLDCPSEEHINSAIEELILLGAFKESSNLKNCELTTYGEMMVHFPLDPKFSKIVISSKKFKCTDEILTIVAILSVESLLVTPLNENDIYSKIHKKFTSKDGDHVMLLNIYKSYKSSNNVMEWCRENFVNLKSMKNAMAIRKQLSQICRRIDIPPRSCGTDTFLIRKCLATGMFINSAQICNNNVYKTFMNNQKVQIHPSSCVFAIRPSLCIYTELVETSKCYMRNISVVEEKWLKEASPTFFRNKRFRENYLMEIDH